MASCLWCRDGHLRRLRGLAGEDGVLATSTGPHDLLAAHGGIVDEGRHLDVVGRALAGLEVGGETPRVSLAVLGDGEAVVGAGADAGDILDGYEMLGLHI